LSTTTDKMDYTMDYVEIPGYGRELYIIPVQVPLTLTFLLQYYNTFRYEMDYENGLRKI
jgi:hypothetical protein